MQRKKTRDYYPASVDLGSTIIPSVRMRKMSPKKLLKYAICIVIGFIIYSIYQKYQMAGTSGSDRRGDSSLHDVRPDDYAVDEERDGQELPRRVKEHINKAFNDFKEKQDQKQNQEVVKQDVFDLFNADKVAEIDDDNVVDANDDNIAVDVNNEDNIVDVNDDNDNVDEMFGEEDRNVDLNEIPDNLFEPVDEEKEKAGLEIEQEIEELLADAFKENEGGVNEAVEEGVPPEQNEIALEEARKKLEADFIKEDMDKKFGPDMMEQFVLNQPMNVKPENLLKMNIARQLKPADLKRLDEIVRKKADVNDDDHEFPPFVTAVRQTTFKQVMQLVASIQQHMPGRKVYIYDLDLEKYQKKEFMAICGVRVRLFMKKLFPPFVQNLDNLNWKPLVMQTALAEFGHITWINPTFRLGTQQLAPLIHESHEKGILVIGQSVTYSTFSATHPSMLKFIATDKDKLSKNPHIEIRAIILHNTDEIHENIMRVFTACALEETCLAPPGSKWQCMFDFTGRKHADCHRFDESALNILLKNMFDFDMTAYARRNNYFRPYDVSYRPKLKMCRDVNDIRDFEL